MIGRTSICVNSDIDFTHGPIVFMHLTKTRVVRRQYGMLLKKISTYLGMIMMTTTLVASGHTQEYDNGAVRIHRFSGLPYDQVNSSRVEEPSAEQEARILPVAKELGARPIPPVPSPSSPKELVRAFIDVVRSGKAPERAGEFLADSVIAHQMNAENMETVVRTPSNYADHIREFLRLYGPFQFETTELLADRDRVYVRWRQVGRHLGEIDGFAPTGKPLVEIASAVYRVSDGKIQEYWIQIDRQGFLIQLQQGAGTVDGQKPK
jgi:predicted ester cyclase